MSNLEKSVLSMDGESARLFFEIVRNHRRTLELREVKARTP